MPNLLWWVIATVSDLSSGSIERQQEGMKFLRLFEGLTVMVGRQGHDMRAPGKLECRFLLRQIILFRLT